MKTETNEKVSYWISLAKEDIAAAKTMLSGGHFLYVGFMCHQVLEKSLKAFYVKKTGKTAPFIHNLSHIAKNAGLFDRLSSEQRMLIANLQPLNIEARYPTYKEQMLKSLTRTRCRSILRQTRGFYRWLKNQL